MSRLSVVVLAMLLGACLPTVTATPEGQRVKLMTGDPPRGCEELRDVEGSDSGFTEGSANHESAKARMKNAAASLGGNYVRMETAEKAGGTLRLHGTAYRCPVEVTGAAAAK
jgi:hypothetical protein